jgi:iron complex transport system permease protein
MVARVVVAPAELPIGILTALIGSPFFLWILFRGRTGRIM